jgi:hypothetical protein
MIDLLVVKYENEELRVAARVVVVKYDYRDES